MVCHITAEATLLEWDERRFCKTIRHNQATSIPTFFTSPGPISMSLSVCSLKQSRHMLLPWRPCSREWINIPSGQEGGRHRIHHYERSFCWQSGQLANHGQWQVEAKTTSSRSSGWPTAWRQQNLNHKQQIMCRGDQTQWFMPQAPRLSSWMGKVCPFSKATNPTMRPTHLWSFPSQSWTGSSLNGKGSSSWNIAVAPLPLALQLQDIKGIDWEWGNSWTSCQGPPTKMCWMPLWCTHSKSKANKRSQQQAHQGHDVTVHLLIIWSALKLVSLHS